MIGAQRNILQSLGAVDVGDVDPVLLPMDSATVRCRRVLDQLRRKDGVRIPGPGGSAQRVGGRRIQRQSSPGGMTAKVWNGCQLSRQSVNLLSIRATVIK